MERKMVLGRGLIILGILSLPYFAGCGSGASQSLNNQPPSITTISPNTAAAGGAPFTLTINGTNFVAASMVNFGGTARTTTFVSATQLTAAIPAAGIASVGTVPVTVTNPAPGGTSNAMSFSITSGGNPVPSINSLDPSCAPVGGQGFTLAVSGSSFVSSSVVRWNGSDRPTTFDKSGQLLSAQIPASDIAAAGTAAVTVFSPPPGGGGSATLPFSVATGGVSPQSITVDPTGKFAYVANYGCPGAFAGNVSMYTINPTTGALTSIGPPVAAASGTLSVTVDPFSKFAYVANYFSKDVSIYSIDATTGTLLPRETISAGGNAVSVTVHPSGKFAYVGYGFNCPNDSVSMYTVDPNTGTLTSVGTIPAVATEHVCSFRVWITIDRSARFAYVSGDNCIDGDHSYVSIDTINSTTGALTPAETIGSPTCSGLLSVHPSSKFAYLPNWDANYLSMYSIDGTTGALSLIGTTPAGSNPTSIAIHPSGKFAYVTNFGSNDVSMYSLDATGALSLVGTIPAGSTPRRCAIHPSGKFAYVANSGSNDVSMYSIDATTGALTLIGTVGT